MEILNCNFWQCMRSLTKRNSQRERERVVPRRRTRRDGDDWRSGRTRHRVRVDPFGYCGSCKWVRPVKTQFESESLGFWISRVLGVSEFNSYWFFSHRPGTRRSEGRLCTCVVKLVLCCVSKIKLIISFLFFLWFFFFFGKFDKEHVLKVRWVFSILSCDTFTIFLQYFYNKS